MVLTDGETPSFGVELPLAPAFGVDWPLAMLELLEWSGMSYIDGVETCKGCWIIKAGGL